jgi:ribosome-binding factor A
LGEIAVTELRDPRIVGGGVVSVTDVEVSADLQTAKVYLSVSADDQEARDQALEGFRSAASYLRGEVGRRLRLRRVPQLHFELDETLRRARRIERILEEVTPEPDDPGSEDDSGERQ